MAAASATVRWCSNPRKPENLPFWLFNFEEIVDVLFGGRPGVPEELDVLAEIIPMAKGIYTQYQNSDRLGLKRMDPKSGGYTVDTPVPYRLVDLISLIDERMGKLENRSSRIIYHKLIFAHREPCATIRATHLHVRTTPMSAATPLAEVISHLFRLPANGRPMTIMQLAGLPPPKSSIPSCRCCAAWRSISACGATASRRCCSFCEEGAPLRLGRPQHRFSARPGKPFSRIAKEGRKYGVFSRPRHPASGRTRRHHHLPVQHAVCDAGLPTTATRALLRSAVSDAAANLLSFVPSLGTREVLAFGEGVALPTRLRFKEVSGPPTAAQRSHHRVPCRRVAAGHDMHFVSAVLDRWRGGHLEPATCRTIPASATGPAARRHDAGGSADAASPRWGWTPDRFLAPEKGRCAEAGSVSRGFLSREAVSTSPQYDIWSRQTPPCGLKPETFHEQARYPTISAARPSTSCRRISAPGSLRWQEKIRLRPERLPDAGFTARTSFRAFFAYHDALMEKDSGPDQGPSAR